MTEDSPSDEAAGPRLRAAELEPAAVHDALSAMTPRIGRPATLFARRFFSGFALDSERVNALRALEQQGAVVYVMRYGSRLDYLLFNWLFLRQGIRLSVFANGIRSWGFRAAGPALRVASDAVLRRIRRGPEGRRADALEVTRAAVRGGQSIFLFLRTDRRGSVIQPRRAVAAAREVDFLREIVAETFEDSAQVSLVPLAMFWRKGASKEPRRFIDVLYGSPDRPTPTWKLFSFLFSYRNLAVRVGRPFDLRGFVDSRREGGLDRAVKQVRRALLIFLRREEKPVLGAVLRSRARIAEAVLADPDVRTAIEASAAAEQVSRSRVEARAIEYLKEIAAHPNSTVIALLDLMVSWVSRRLFARIEIIGLDRVVEAAKLHPLVLVPSHRSHFDYLLLSWLFYENHLAPPLVAAGANLSFWPLGPIFRRAGAFFLRRSFEGDRVYTSVFRSYVQLLIKDGITQEFFIEGTRSRTGKTLQPRLGLIGMVLDAFRRGVRRDVLIVPVGFTYERLVEERAMTEEKRGARKVQESLRGLLQAHSVLGSRFGEVVVRFGEPISLAEVAGRMPKPDPSDPINPVRQGELRAVAGRLGEDICRRINQLVTAGGSALAAAVLLGRPGRALRVVEFRESVSELAVLVRRAGLALSDSLEAALQSGDPENAAALLLQSGLVERRTSRGGDLLHFPESAREALAYYRATIAPALAVPAVLALVLQAERGSAPSQKDVLDRASNWLRLLRFEYFPPPPEERRERLREMLDHFRARGWIREVEGRLETRPDGVAWLALLVAQVRPILENYRAFLTGVRETALPQAQEKVFADASAALEEHLLLGEARHSEAVCPTTSGNALQAFLEEEILIADGNPRRSGTRIDRGPRWGGLEEWLSRLARVLG